MSYKVEDFIEDIITGREIGLRYNGVEYNIWSSGGVGHIALEEGGDVIWTEPTRKELAEKGRIEGKLLTEIFDEIEIIDIA